MFLLDGKSSDISDEDILRRNLIAKLLEDWGLVTIVDKNDISNIAPISYLKILSYKDKESWELVAKYTIGSKDKFK
jgi:hypothetical protein